MASKAAIWLNKKFGIPILDLSHLSNPPMLKKAVEEIPDKELLQLHNAIKLELAKREAKK